MTSGNGSGGSFIIHSPGARSGFGPRVAPAPAPEHPPDAVFYELDALRRQIEAIKEEPLLVATIVEMRGERMMISLGPGGTLDVHAIEGAAVGRRVRCNRNTMQAIDLLPEEAPTGTILTSIRDTSPGELVEAEVLGTVRGFKSSRSVRKGERVIVDPSLTFAIGSLGMPPAQYAYARETLVTWDDVGGQAEAKAAIRESIEIPFAHAELFAAYGKRLPRGVLLHGPSGTGKTLIAMAASTAVARAHGKDAGARGGFISVKGPELLASFIGRTEEAIRRIFAAAREYKRNTGVPAVVFFDECDSLMSRRDRNEHTTLNATIVPQFLAEMDGLDDAAAIVILATNRPDMLDPAIVRDGRIDYRVRVGRPSQDDARAIALIHLAERPLDSMTRDEAAAAIADGIFAHGAEIASYANGAERVTLHLRHFVTGAMIQRAIEAAATSAMLRDIEAAEQKATSRGPRASGITREDIMRALDRAAASVEHTTHSEALNELSSTP